MRKQVFFYQILSLVLILITYIYANHSYPLAGFLVGDGRFADWWGTIASAQKYPESTWLICTVPWMHIAFLRPLGALMGPYLLHILYIILTLIVFTPVYQYVAKRTDTVFALCSLITYPIIFAFWRGNTDLIIFGLLLNAWIALRENKVRNSLIWFGTAATFKPFSLAYLVIFKIRDLLNNYRIILIGTILVIALILIGNPQFFNSLNELRACGAEYTAGYIIGDNGTLHNNSLLGLFKFVVYSQSSDFSSAQQRILDYSLYLRIWPFLLVVLFFTFNYKVPVIEDDQISNSIFLLNLLTVILLPISPDYRLYLVSISFIILSISKVSNHLNKKFIELCLLLILLPKHILWLKYFDVDFTLNAPLNTVAILFLLGYLAYQAQARKLTPQSVE